MANPVSVTYNAAASPVVGGRFLVSEFWRNLAPGWTEITTSGPQPGNGIYAYSGMALDTLRGKLYFHGGGHNDYAGNDTWELDLETRAFTQHYLPDVSPNPPLATARALVDNTNYPGAIVIGGVPVRPVGRHTYMSVHYVPALDVMTVGGGSTYSGDGEYLWFTPPDTGAWWGDGGDFWTYHPTAKTFSYKGSNRLSLTNYAGSRFTAHPTDGKLYALTGDSNGYLQCRVTDVATGVTTIRTSKALDKIRSMVALTFEPSGQYIYALTQQYYASGDVDLLRYDVTNDTFTVLPVNSGSGPSLLNEGTNIVYSSKARKIYVLQDTAFGMYAYDIDAGTWTHTATPQLDLFSQVSGRMIYDNRRKVLLLVYPGQYTGTRVWVYKD